MQQPCIHAGWLENTVNEEMCPVAPFLKLEGPLFALLKVGKAQQGRPSWKAPKCSHCPFLPLHTHPTSGLRDTVLGALHLVRSSSLPPRSSAPTREENKIWKVLAVGPGYTAEPVSSASGMTKPPCPSLPLMPACSVGSHVGFRAGGSSGWACMRLQCPAMQLCQEGSGAPG